MRQGDAIVRLLFNGVLEIAVIRFKVETWGTISDKCSQIMAYTDDMVIVGGRLQDVKESTSVVRKTNKMGLEINEEKTKLVIVSWEPYHENEYVKLGTCNFEMVKDISWYNTNKWKWIKIRDWKMNYKCK